MVQNSQLRSIRAIHTGDTTMSAVRRPSLQRAYIREVSKQTTILRLHGVLGILLVCLVVSLLAHLFTIKGFLFFGTITYVEESIRSLIEGPSWQSNPVQFLVLDLTLVAGVDMSSAEAFVRIHRLLAAKYVTLVFCGFTNDSTVGNALRSVDVLGADGVELFLTFNDAIECMLHCESFANWRELICDFFLLGQGQKMPISGLGLSLKSTSFILYHWVWLSFFLKKKNWEIQKTSILQ